MRLKLTAAVLLCLVWQVGRAETPRRWIPEHCVALAEPLASGSAAGGQAETRWNDAYLQGFRAIQRGELGLAESQMCRALLEARDFAPRDWRFAETLDELGLIAFELRDYDLAERLQGAAIAEMLLAVGPGGEPLREHEASEQSPIRDDCRSGVRVYTARLGLILERVRSPITLEKLRAAPWHIFEAGYLPLDVDLAQRLEWLISRYLLEENPVAAEDLGRLRREILGTE